MIIYDDVQYAIKEKDFENPKIYSCKVLGKHQWSVHAQLTMLWT